jgi:signal transduction histidine kinase
MKRFFLTFLIVTFAYGAFAQNATLNRLKIRLNAATNDLAKVQILDSLSMYNMFFYHGADSTFNYCQENINRAIQLPDKKYLVLAYARLSFYYFNVSQYRESLSAALKGVDLAEQYHTTDYLSSLYYNLTWCYQNLNEERQALKYAFLGIRYLKENKDPFFDQSLHLYGLTGLCYQNLDKGDSAIFYYKKMSAASLVSKELSARVIADFHWVLYYLFYTKQYRKADSVIADGIKQCRATGDFLLGAFYIYSANSALGQNNIPKAITQAKMGLKLSALINYRQGERTAAALLASIYGKVKKQDSAYYYLKKQDSLKAVVDEHGNALGIQQFQFDQQLNKKEKAAAGAIQQQRQWTRTLIYVFATAFAFLIVILTIQWRNSAQKRKANETLQKQKEKVESTLMELRSAQTQLIQREKMASLGELTAGIAHEIQNPLNFVNNFSEINREMIDELEKELKAGHVVEALKIAAGIKQNEEKINHHGKRADSIVKGMLAHSRVSSGHKEPTNINKLAAEYLRLAYQGLRAKDKSFNAQLVTTFDVALPTVNVIPQDIGRVLLNLFNNAFYAVRQKQNTAGATYRPEVSVTTNAENGKAIIKVKDNGTGIPDNIKDKIMQPFFTTKPAGQGTGLGLSLTYDIVVKGHGGNIKVDSVEGEGTEFTIVLPMA